MRIIYCYFFFSSRRRHTRCGRDWSSDVCSSDLQRTLRGTIEWSYDLLLAEEKALFERLGVLVGGCRPEAAEALCDADGELGIDVLDGLGSLVEKSLLRQKADSDGEPRFWMLETIREYACELLEASGELEAGQRSH